MAAKGTSEKTTPKPTARETNISMVCTAILKLVELITHQYATPKAEPKATRAEPKANRTKITT